MPLIQISNEQRDAAIANANDAANAFEFGIYDQSFGVVSPPLSGYTGFDDSVKQDIKDGLKQFFAINARYWQPVAASFYDASPSRTISSEVLLGSVSVVSFIPRKVAITLNLSAYSSDINTDASFSVSISGSPVSPPLHFFFNTASVHQSMGGTWVATLPVGASVIGAFLNKSGSGNLIQDAGDSVSLSVIG